MKKKLIRLLSKPERVFVILVIPIGLLYAFIIPPFQVTDEGNHLLRAYSVSKLQFVASRQDDEVGALLPPSINETVFSFRSISRRPDQKADLHAIRGSFDKQLKPAEETFTGFRNTALYTAVPYMASALAVGIGRTLEAPPIVLMYMARLANLALWIVLMFFAIKLTGFAKWSFVLIGLIPMALSVATSASIDPAVTGLTILFSGAVFRYAFNPKVKNISKKHVAFLFLLIIGIAFCKPPYALIGGLFFLIPRSKFRLTSTRYWLLAVGLLGVGIVVTVLWPLIMQSRNAVLLPDYVDTGIQIKFLFTQPWQFVWLFFKYYVIGSSTYIFESIGRLGWLDTDIPLSVFIGYIVMLIVSARIGLPKITRLHYVLAWLLSLALVVAISAVFYVNWTPPYHPSLEGIQGRYFIPLFPLFLLAGSWFGIGSRKLQAHPGIATMVFVCFAQLISLTAILLRYYDIPWV